MKDKEKRRSKGVAFVLFTSVQDALLAVEEMDGTLLEGRTLKCSIAKEKYPATEFTFDLTPKVKFENGKAIEAHAAWGKIEAPTLIKSALWTATAADNTINLLSSTIVEEVNDFVGKRCDEVKDQWAAKQ